MTKHRDTLRQELERGGTPRHKLRRGAMEAHTEDQAVGGKAKGRPLAAQETPQRHQGGAANAP